MIRINLLADRHAKDRRIIQQQVQLAMFLVAVAAALCVVWLGVKSTELSNVEANISKQQEEKKKLEGIKKKVEEMEARQKQVEAILKTINELKDIKTGPWPYLDKLNELIPEGVWLTDLDDRMGNIKLVGFAIANQELSRFMTQLTGSGEFTAVELKESVLTSIQLRSAPGKSNAKDVHKFTINCMTLMSKKKEDKRKAEEEAAKKAKAAAAPPKRGGGGGGGGGHGG